MKLSALTSLDAFDPLPELGEKVEFLPRFDPRKHAVKQIKPNLWLYPNGKMSYEPPVPMGLKGGFRGGKLREYGQVSRRRDETFSEWYIRQEQQKRQIEKSNTYFDLYRSSPSTFLQGTFTFNSEK